MAGPEWVGDAAEDQAASPSCSPDLSAISLGHSQMWEGLSAEGQKELSGDKPPVLTSALGRPSRLAGPPWQCCCPHHVPVNTSVKDLLSLSLSLSSSFFIPCSAPQPCVYLSNQGTGDHFTGPHLRNSVAPDLCHRLWSTTRRGPQFPAQLLRTLEFSACVRGFQFTEGFPSHLQTFSFRL